MLSQQLIEIRGVGYSTPTGRVLQEGLNATLENRQLLLITGSNGSGKSTLLKAILGQVPIERGTISLTVPEGQIEYLPQLENTEIHLPLTLGDVLAISQKKRVSWESISDFGLLRKEHMSTAWNTASGGERKRTLLTRALIRKPWFLIFDEPMNHLDKGSRAAMVKVLADFLSSPSREPRGIIMVCHQGLPDGERNLFDTVHLNLDGGENGAAD